MEDRSESVELTNMCMIQNGTKILVEDRKNKTWAGVTFPGGHIDVPIGRWLPDITSAAGIRRPCAFG